MKVRVTSGFSQPKCEILSQIALKQRWGRFRPVLNVDFRSILEVLLILSFCLCWFYKNSELRVTGRQSLCVSALNELLSQYEKASSPTCVRAVEMYKWVRVSRSRDEGFIGTPYPLFLLVALEISNLSLSSIKKTEKSVLTVMLTIRKCERFAVIKKKKWDVENRNNLILKHVLKTWKSRFFSCFKSWFVPLFFYFFLWFLTLKSFFINSFFIQAFSVFGKSTCRKPLRNYGVFADAQSPKFKMRH